MAKKKQLARRGQLLFQSPLAYAVEKLRDLYVHQPEICFTAQSLAGRIGTVYEFEPIY